MIGKSLGTQDMVSIATLLDLYVAQNQAGVPKYDRDAAKFLLKKIRKDIGRF